MFGNVERHMRPKVRLSRLRDIGWNLWDPIGLLDEGQSWEHQAFADEYDTYLVQAASRLRRNVPVDEVINYLAQIESVHMGLGDQPGSNDRLRKVVDAILADDQIWSE